MFFVCLRRFLEMNKIPNKRNKNNGYAKEKERIKKKERKETIIEKEVKEINGFS